MRTLFKKAVFSLIRNVKRSAKLTRFVSLSLDLFPALKKRVKSFLVVLDSRQKYCLPLKKKFPPLRSSQAKTDVKKEPLPQKIAWCIDGPFDSTYSLALVNRELARALKALGHDLAINFSEESPNQRFLQENPDIAQMVERNKTFVASVSSHNSYPPYVCDMQSKINLLHNYAWEESGFPMQWIKEFNLHLHGAACVSEHVRKIMQDHGLKIPLIVSGNGVDHWEQVVADRSFAVRGKTFKFLHLSSCFPRKGIKELLSAYGRAFSKADDVTLVIKTFSNPHNEIHRWLKEVQNSSYPDLLVIEQDLTAGEIKALYQQCHALVAPSKAEGFGLPLAEAMLCNLPVITTGWGGQLEFCTPETSWLVDYHFERAETHLEIFNSVWAQPDIDHLGATMRAVFEAAPEIKMERVNKGKELLLAHFRWSNVARRLEESVRNWALLPAKKCSLVGWISPWNTRCGIAAYSENLISQFFRPPTIFAPYLSHIFNEETNVVRCWESKKSETFAELDQQLGLHQIEIIVIQFNYGLFHLKQLESFIKRQALAGRKVVITLHSTRDSKQSKKLSLLTDALSRCARILVHTPLDLNRLKAMGLVNNVTLFPHGFYKKATNLNKGFFSCGSAKQPTTQLANKIRFERFCLGTYGFCLPHKGLVELIDTIALLRRDGIVVQLKMVNAQYPGVDSALVIQQIKQKIEEEKLNAYVDLVTDYLTNEESIAQLSACDLIVYPYQVTDESCSGAVRLGLASGNPVAVTPLSIFEDVSPAVFQLPGITPRLMAKGIIELMRSIEAGAEVIAEKEQRASALYEEYQFERLSERLDGMLQSL